MQIKHPFDAERLQRLSLIEEGPEKKVRMAHLAVVGSHSINGVAELHTEEMAKEFSDVVNAALNKSAQTIPVLVGSYSIKA